MEQRLDVAAEEVLGGAAFDAEQMVMVSPVAQLVLKIAVLQQHPAQHARLHQQLERTEDSCPPQRGQLRPQVFGGEGLVLVGDGAATAHIEALAERAALPVLKAEIVPEKNIARLRGKPLVAFSGIGYPDKFFKTLDALGGDIAARISFADHHRFTPQDADALLESAANLGAQLVTTEKDMARLEGESQLERLKSATITLPVKMKFSDERAAGKLVASALDQG